MSISKCRIDDQFKPIETNSLNNSNISCNSQSSYTNYKVRDIESINSNDDENDDPKTSILENSTEAPKIRLSQYKSEFKQSYIPEINVDINQVRNNMDSQIDGFSALVKGSSAPQLLSLWSSKRAHFYNLLISNKNQSNNSSKQKDVMEQSEIFDSANFLKIKEILINQQQIEILSSKVKVSKDFEKDKLYLQTSSKLTNQQQDMIKILSKCFVEVETLNDLISRIKLYDIQEVNGNSSSSELAEFINQKSNTIQKWTTIEKYSLKCLDYLIDHFSQMVERHTVYSQVLISLTSLRSNIFTILASSAGGVGTFVGAMTCTIQGEISKIILFKLASVMVKYILKNTVKSKLDKMEFKDINKQFEGTQKMLKEVNVSVETNIHQFFENVKNNNLQEAIQSRYAVGKFLKSYQEKNLKSVEENGEMNIMVEQGKSFENKTEIINYNKD